MKISQIKTLKHQYTIEIEEKYPMQEDSDILNYKLLIDGVLNKQSESLKEIELTMLSLIENDDDNIVVDNE